MFTFLNVISHLSVIFLCSFEDISHLSGGQLCLCCGRFGFFYVVLPFVVISFSGLLTTVPSGPTPKIRILNGLHAELTSWVNP